MTIPASDIVVVNPGVVGTGGSPLALNGVILTKSLLLPTRAVRSFTSADAVSDFFGPASDEYAAALVYFLGFDNSTIKPGTLYFAPYVDTDRPAWIQSGSMASVTLAQMQAFTAGVMAMTIDGIARTSASINLASATSQSDAASKIQTALNTTLPEQATSTAGTISGTTLTITGTNTGTFAAGSTVTGTGVTANSIILAQLTSDEVDEALGGDGTYQLSESSTVAAPTAITATATPAVVSWNSVLSTFIVTSGVDGSGSTIGYGTGDIATLLKMTSATGAILSQGDDADTPATAMDSVKALTQNWVDFTTMWEPDTANKTLFAVWANAQNQRYMYVCWDTDAQAIVNGSTTCFGAVAKDVAYDGVMCVYDSLDLALFVLGAVASIDFSRTNGRTTTAFKSQSGFTPTVTDSQIAANLLENGYSFYGSYATAHDQFNFLYNGQLPGKWLWLDTFVNQVYLNSQFQLALMSLLTGVGSIPYNQAGYSLIRAAMIDPIQAALNFGSIRTGITMSASQKAQVNQAAGVDCSTFIEQLGYYLQILDPGAQVRGNRGTPVINFWYTDGGAVQMITVASIDIL